jgi:uncharacterized protein YcbK (DUF882 family)
MQISKYVSYNEATKSQTAIRHGIKNEPNDEQLQNMKIVAIKCFDPIREFYKRPLRVSSFYRCEELNKLVKGAKNSQHLKGQAIDIDAGSIQENKKIFEWAKDNLEYDQLINEYNFSWVHISYNQGKNRKQIVVIK